MTPKDQAVALTLLKQYQVGTHVHKNGQWECTMCRQRADDMFAGITHLNWCPTPDARALILRNQPPEDDTARDVERDGGGKTSITGDPDSDIARVIQCDLDALGETIRRS